MILRIVQLSFREESIKDFTDLFEDRKQTIRGFKGCNHLELWQDNTHPHIFFTYSMWDSQSDLDHYRFSEFFKDTWGRTKALFAEKPQVWSVSRKSIG